MHRVGRPRTVDRPPCPRCAREDHVHAHGFRHGHGVARRAFRCARCERSFTPGAAPRRADAAVKTAVRRVRHETGVPYRLLARALTAHLGVPASHATVGAWCRDAGADTGARDGAPCEYLSLLWAVRHEIETELTDDA